MSNRLLRLTGLLAAFVLLAGSALAQSPSPDASAAARELIETMHLADQYKVILPPMMKAMKPAIVQGRSNIERDYDAMMPSLLEGFNARVGELLEAFVIIYANNFSAEDLRAMTAFYKTPTGQKFLQKTPAVMQQAMTAGQKFGQSVGAEMQKRMIEELRKKGHDL